MKLIVAGSRSLGELPIQVLDSVLKNLDIKPTAILSGMCGHSPDMTGEVWSVANKCKLLKFPADWKTKGKAAGKIRNIQMANNADGLIAFWDGISGGTAHMISTMAMLNKYFVVVSKLGENLVIREYKKGVYFWEM